MNYRELIPYMDLTSLNEKDTAVSITQLCQKAVTAYGNVAAVCVYPRFIKQSAVLLKSSGVKIATVVNFPQGNTVLEEVLRDIDQSIDDGAEEIDMVFPYQAYLQGKRDWALSFVKACKAHCQIEKGGRILLKVILETGAMSDVSSIAEAAHGVFFAGADFVKTSTGKITPGATLEAAAIMLEVIKTISPLMQRTVGLKVSGGIREPEQAMSYLLLAQKIMGHSWATPHIFRIGASTLVDKLN